MNRIICALGAAFSLACPPFTAAAQCVSDPVNVSALQFDADYLFGGLDASLGGDFPAWLTRWQQENATDPTAGFQDEDNSQNGINDDDHLDLIAAILEGEPAATVMPGVSSANVSAIRASYAANRAKVRPDLTLVIIFVTVNIIDEINADNPEFGASLQDLVAAYMTIGDAESVAYIRGLLITLGEIFIEIGVQNGDIPALVEGLTKTTLRNTVNANFVASRYECYGDVAGAAKPNLLGDTGDLNGSGQTNEAAYAAAGGDRQAWLVSRGIALPPLEIAVPPADITVFAGEAAAFSPTLAGGTGAGISYDWKRVNETTGATSAYATGAPLEFAYPLAADAGLYQLFVCDGTWTRAAMPARLTVSPAAFSITAQPQGATRGVGGSVDFSVTVRGGETVPTYQWYFGDSVNTLSPIGGQTGRVLSLSGLGLDDAGVYQCRIAGGPLTSPVTLESNAVALAVEELIDEIAPVLTLTGANPLNVECGAAFTDPGATAEDETDGDLTGEIAVEGTVNTGEPGEYLLTYSVSDAAGNLAEVSRTVNVTDALAPQLTLLGADPLILECKAAFTDPGATANDTCDGALGNIAGSGTVNTNAPGSYLRTYTVSDASGNTTSITRTVQVVDTVAPQITRIGAASIAVACGGTLNDPAATASDACAGNLTPIIEVSGAVDVNTPGTYTRTYTVSDPAGNTAGTTREFVVSDSVPPVITLLGASNITIACGGALNDPGATALDACGGVSLQVSTGGTVDTSTPGLYQRTYSATDATGNTAQISRTFEVTDSTAPVVTLNGAATLTVACQGAFNDPGATALDACGETVLTVLASGGVDTNTPGSYTLTYSSTDGAGNTGTATRTVEVVDRVAPVVTLNGAASLALACGTEYIELGATAVDACDGALEVTAGPAPDTGNLATYDVTYTATDSSGNTGSVTRTVLVELDAPPVISVAGGDTQTVACGTEFVGLEYSVVAPCLGDLTASVEVTGTVDTTEPGAYPIQLSLPDFGGGPALKTVTVSVVDSTAPAITLMGPSLIEIACGAAYTDPGATALDACAGDLTAGIAAEGSVDNATPGDYLITYAVEDPTGNTAAKTRTVRVAGTAEAVIALAGETGLSLSCGEEYDEAGFAATDVCGGDAAARVTVTGSVNSGRPGTYTLTYALAQADGGPAQAVRTVTVLPDCAILFTTQPAGQNLYVGQRASFVVVATGGSAALSYQWYRDDEAIAGAFSSVLVIDPVAFEDAGAYRCVVSDGFTEAASDVAELGVFTRPESGQQSADTNGDWSISLSELLRLIQFYNSGGLYCLDGTEDGYAPGAGDQTCAPHNSDYAPQNWALSLSELLRAIQFYNTPGGAYRAEAGTEDGFAPGAG